MWALVRADFSYTRWGMLVLVILTAFNFYQSVHLDGWDFYSFISNTAGVAMIVVAVIAISVDNEKRDRTMMGLPVPVTAVGFARMLYIVVVQAGLMVVWTVFMLLRPGGPAVADVWAMFTAAGVVVASFSVIAIHHDLGFFGTRRYRMRMYGALLGMVVLIALMVAIGVAKDVFEWYFHSMATLGGALFHVALAAVLFVSQVRVFTRRQSYLA